MSTCRNSLLAVAIMLLVGSVGLCQPPHTLPAGNFKYAHTAYPTTSYPATTNTTPKSEWASNKDSQLQDAPADRNLLNNEESTRNSSAKPGSGDMSSFRKWFSRSSERSSKSRTQQPPFAKDIAPAQKDHAPTLVAPPNASAQAGGANQLGSRTPPADSALSGVAKDKSALADPRSSVSPSGSSVGRTSVPSKNSVTAAFGGILPEDSPRDDVKKTKTVQTTTAKSNQILPTGGILPSSLPSSEAELAVVRSPVAENPLHRPKIIFQPVAGGVDSRGNALLRPSVQVAANDAILTDPDGVQLAQFAEEGTLPLPPQAQQAPETAYPVDEEWMPPVVSEGEYCDCEGSGGFGHHHSHGHGFGHGNNQGYVGVGREYVMHAPFFIDRSEPFNNCFIRGDAAANWEFPDRAEYFWAKTPGGKGPPDPGVDGMGIPLNRGETSVDYQDIVFSIERGGERFSIATDIPIRAIDPEIRGCTTGLADMEVTSKIVVLDGCRFQLTQIFSTHLPTGSFRRGTGNGHVSLEPGIAYRYKWNDKTYFHGDLTYLFPVGADPFFSGQFLNYGIALSHVWIDADTYAIIPTIEVDAWTVLDGQQTLPGSVFDPGTPAGPGGMPPAVPPSYSAQTEEVDSIGIVNVHPGLRWVCDKGGDCGVKEFGISSGICVTQDSWYEELLRIEFRWSR